MDLVFKKLKNNKTKFIIYTESYDEGFGGIIVLYKLCSILNNVGIEAFIWPASKPYFDNKNILRYTIKSLKYYINKLFRLKDFRSPYNLRIASISDLKDAIVVYPEIISGNPLYAKKVVRWFLHKPGFHSGVINYQSDELYFYFSKEFDDPVINPFSDNELTILDIKSDIYKQTNFDVRSGTCYMIRKGRNRDLNYHHSDAVLIDNLSHEEVAKAFNKFKYFVSYDPYTMYSLYAAFCGCISIVVPMEGVNKEGWRSSEELRLGIAYGSNDIEWALSSRDRLLEKIGTIDRNSESSVYYFVKKCSDFFEK